MKKRNYARALAAGMAGLMICLSGCSGQTKAESGSQAAETVAESESQTEAETVTESESQAAAENGGQTAAEAGTQAESEGPVHIWGSIISVDEEGILVDNQSDNSSKGEMLLTVDPEHTAIVDAAGGLPVNLGDIQIGSFEAYLGPAMTMSLPPHVTPYVVIVNISDGRPPQYVVARDSIQATDSGNILIAGDGTEYVLAEDAEITPYLTRNIVTLEDIKEGSRLLVWLNGEDKAEKLVLFAE